MAPPSTASGTVHSADRSSAMSALLSPLKSRSGRRASRAPASRRRSCPAAPAPWRRAGRAALQQAAAGADAAEQDRDRNDRERILPRQEGDQDAGEAVAGGERWRWCGPAPPRPRSCRRGRRRRRREAADDDQLADAAARASVAARMLPPATRAAKPNTVCRSGCRRARGDDAEDEPPCTSMPGMLPIMLAAPISRVDGLLRLVGIAHRALDQMVDDRDARYRRAAGSRSSR